VRYYPQLLELTDDVAAEWVLALWTMAPSPVRQHACARPTLARLLKQHRIRRINAETAINILRVPIIKVAEGVTEAAVLHLRSLVCPAASGQTVSSDRQSTNSMSSALR